jgi:pimeloyl-ACP methyl ester carboxylesterase
MATIGGHGFGAKVAAATAISNLNRFTGVIQLEGGPLDHRYYEAYQELTSYIQVAAKINIGDLDIAQVHKALDEGILCKKWNSIFKQNISAEGSSLSWKFNVSALDADTRKYKSETGTWDSSYGLWPGQALAIFAANSRWIHLSTNTL